MARIRPLTKDEVSPELRPVLEASERWLGQPSIGTGIRAWAPPILEASNALGAAPAKSGLLSPELRSLVCLRAAEMVGCPF
jgi:alkylhydroperoxidase family enzyme